jgi:hypothetical protein
MSDVRLLVVCCCAVGRLCASPLLCAIKTARLAKGLLFNGGGNNTHSSLMLFILTHAIHIIVLQRKEALAVQANVLTII